MPFRPIVQGIKQPNMLPFLAGLASQLIEQLFGFAGPERHVLMELDCSSVYRFLISSSKMMAA
jgi:hypothetical protein